MRRSRSRQRAFALLVALGVSVVAFLVVFAMTASIDFSLHNVDRVQGELQAQAMVRSAVDYALWMTATNRAKPGQPIPFEYTVDHLRETKLRGEATVEPVAADHPVYTMAALSPRPGDVLVKVKSEQMTARYGTGQWQLLCSTTGQRSSPIDVTARLASPAGQ